MIITRFVAMMREKGERRFFYKLIAAKMAGLGVVFAGIWGFTQFLAGSPAFADAPVSAKQMTDVVNATNTAWTLVAAFLVFFMQAGFMMLEAGFARQRETVNVLLECIVDTSLCGLLFWAFGFAFMFGAGNGWIGHQYFFLNNAPATYGSTGVAFTAYFFLLTDLGLGPEQVGGAVAMAPPVSKRHFSVPLAVSTAYSLWSSEAM